MCDSGGIMTKKREKAGDLNEYKARFALDIPEGTVGDAIKGADVY